MTIQLDGTRQTLLEWPDISAFNGGAVINYFRGYAWSPDSSQIAFSSSIGLGDQRYGALVVTNLEGTNLRHLTGPGLSVNGPDWSPDGSQIVFSGFDRTETGLGTPNLYIINVDGSGLKQLTFDGGYKDARWSPTGQEIVFAQSPARAEPFIIFIVNADGSNRQQLTQADLPSPQAAPITRSNDFPSWSPDGTKIVFISGRDGTSEVYVMNADGSEQTRLTFGDGNKGSPRWSPDGQKILFTSRNQNQSSLYLINPDGSGEISLDTSNFFSPAWRP